jgi:hypothetical protein
MRFRALAVALGLGALAATPCLALTVQAGPPRPDVAQHLRSSTAPVSSVLPAPSELKGSFAASGRPQLGQGFSGSASAGATSFDFGPLHATARAAPGYGASWSDNHLRDSGNPLSLMPPRR